MFSPCFTTPGSPSLKRIVTFTAVVGLCLRASIGFAGSTYPTPTPPPSLPGGAVTASDAGRLLIQSTFGPTDVLIGHVQQVGVSGFINEQAAAAPTSHVAILQEQGITPDDRGRYYHLSPWWQNAVAAPDQLRQRVAFALSEIMVVSSESPRSRSYGVSGYVDVLCKDAFGTFRRLLEDVTLSPEMGAYLNMQGNAGGPAAGNNHPNENYAREVMQLFTIGLNQLNPDGTLQLDANGQPIPTYTQDTVTNFARVFTGWTFAPVAGGSPSWKSPPNWLAPMVAVAGYHDTAAKTLLNGQTVPAGGTSQSDLKAALDNLANHTNVGPFFSKKLIQLLVTSNPSPGYVYRVATVFNNDGNGLRGNLKAVLTAILTDYEARSADWAAGTEYGKEREPVIRVTNLLRAFPPNIAAGNYPAMATTDDLAESPLQAASVFNFFQPTYTVPGAIASNGLVAPEFQITSESATISSANFLHGLIANGVKSNHVAAPLDFSKVISLAGSPAQVTAYLNTLLMAGTMSVDMQTTLTNAVANITARNPTERARSAVEIVVTSPEFAIQK